jgi:hypothetical protein
MSTQNGHYVYAAVACGTSTVRNNTGTVLLVQERRPGNEVARRRHLRKPSVFLPAGGQFLVRRQQSRISLEGRQSVALDLLHPFLGFSNCSIHVVLEDQELRRITVVEAVRSETSITMATLTF